MSRKHNYLDDEAEVSSVTETEESDSSVEDPSSEEEKSKKKRKKSLSPRFKLSKKTSRKMSTRRWKTPACVDDGQEQDSPTWRSNCPYDSNIGKKGMVHEALSKGEQIPKEFHLSYQITRQSGEKESRHFACPVQKCNTVVKTVTSLQHHWKKIHHLAVHSETRQFPFMSSNLVYNSIYRVCKHDWQPKSKKVDDEPAGLKARMNSVQEHLDAIAELIQDV